MFINKNHKYYVIYLSASIIINSIIIFLIPIWILSETKSPLLVSILSAFNILISSIISPISGTLSDRFSKIKLITCGLVIIIIASSLIFFESSGNIYIPFLFTLVCFREIGISINSPINSSILLNVVGEKNLKDAVPLNQIIFQLSQILSPIIGGFLIIYIGYRYSFILEIVLMFISLVCINKIVIETKHSSNNNLRFLDEFINGFKLILQSTKIFIFILIAAVINIIGASMILSIQTFLIMDNIPQFWYGLVFASSPIGMLIGSVLSRKINWGSNLIYVSFLFVAGMAVFNILMSLTMSNLPLFCILFFISGIFFGFSNVYFGILYRTEINIENQGKFFGFLNTFMIISIPIGTILNGFLLEFINPNLIIFYLGIIVLLISLLSSLYFKKFYNAT